MNRLKIFASLLFLLVTFGCEDNENNSSGDKSQASDLPLLSGKNNPGIVKGFNYSNPPATEDSINARWEEAIDSGMSTGRMQIDWSKLEPEPETYDKELLENKLAAMQNRNLQSFLMISAYDSNGPELPEDLTGMKFDNPTLIKRFKKLMDWVIPMLIKYDGYLISISNEPDNHFGEVPNLHDEIRTFLKKVKDHIHSINENVAVTITMAEGNLNKEKPGMQQIIEEADIACWNFYGSKSINESPYFAAQTESEVRSDIQQMLTFSGNKNIIIQELGMWSGSDRLNSSEKIQKRFFNTFFQEMEKEERIRAAYVFQLVDWSPEVADQYAGIFAEENLPEKYVEAFEESLETMGLIRYKDGKSKLAWDEFVNWVKKFSNNS